MAVLAVLVGVAFLAVALVLRSTMAPASPTPSDDTAAYAPYVYEPVGLAPALPLTDQAGRAFSLDSLKGSTVLINFGYTHCPDVCPTTLAIDREVLRDRPSGVSVVFVTIDPARDTPSALGAYLAYFEEPMTGLTGSASEIATAAAAWGVGYQKGEVSASGSYAMTHTAGTFVVDPAGNLRFLFPYETPKSVLVAAIDALRS
jgi:protein SCO1/2